MKKIGLIAIAYMALFGVICGCSFDVKDDGGSSAKTHNWEIVLSNLNTSVQKFFVTVVNPGGSGTAVVTITENVDGGVINHGNQVVFTGVPIPVGECGLAIVFHNMLVPVSFDTSPTPSFNLALDDAWALIIAQAGAMVVPTEPVQSSTGVAAVPAGDYTCATACEQGLYNALPGISEDLIPLGDLLGGMQLSANLIPSAIVTEDSAFLEADIPEMLTLQFFTTSHLLGFMPTALPPMLVNPGDEITISYTRKFTSDLEGGDLFRVRATNQFEYVELEFLKETSETQTITRTFTANGVYLGLEFMAGLSSAADSLILDDISVSVNDVPIFAENFETGALVFDPTFNWLWMPIEPNNKLGGGSITAGGSVLSGTQSYIFSGGHEMHLWGQMVPIDDFNKGLLFSLAKNDTGYYLGDFQGLETDGNIMGTYNGTDGYQADACTEEGLFFGTEDPEGHADLNGTWTLMVDAELTNCDDPTQEGPFTPYSLPLTGLAVTEIPTPLGGILTILDQAFSPTVFTDHGNNQSSLAGLVINNTAMVMLNTQVPASMFYSAVLMGAAVEQDGALIVAGQIQGSAAPDLMYLYKTCEINGTFIAQVTPLVAD